MLLLVTTLLLVSPATCQDWKLVFRQTIGDEYFAKNQWYKNQKNPDAPNYAVLGDLEKYRLADGSFHLHLWYPELGRGNEWKQTSNPVTAGTGGVLGYQAVNISFAANHWGGLEFNNQNCILDGSIDDAGFWYYAIGSFQEWYGGMPGPEATVHEVELYVAVEDHVRFGPIFASGMVLQSSPQSSVVWGYGREVDHVTLEVLKDDMPVIQLTDTVVDGAWRFTIPGQEAGVGYKVVVSTVQAPFQVAVLEDVRFGQVWVCSGQSNMEFNMFGILDAENEISNSALYTDVRFTKLHKFPSSSAMSDVWGGFEIPWSGPDTQALSMVSAVCFLFGRQLYDQLKVPIGLVETAWGGTIVEAWSSPEVMEDCGLEPHHPVVNDPNDDSALWNSMIAPLLKLSIKGAIWYQGESNSNHNTDAYGCTFPGMVKSWRKNWHQQSNGSTSQDFPFGFVQLGTYRTQVDNKTPNSAWSLIRWHQTADAGTAPSPAFPNTFMAAAMDTHDPASPYGVIHPRDKLTVANRLAWASLNSVYGLSEDFPLEGPQPVGINHEGDKVTVEYDQPIQVLSYSGWQVCRSATAELCDYFTGWVDVEAVSHVEGRSVTLDLSPVCSNGCSSLAYLWRETPCLEALSCPLYGTSQFRLPATPWRFSL